MPSAGEMTSASRRTEKVTWRRTSSVPPDRYGQSDASYDDVAIWVSWMEIGGSERVGDGILSLPGTRVVSYAAWEDPVKTQDLIVRDGNVYDVVGVVELGGHVGYRLELEINAAVPERG